MFPRTLTRLSAIVVRHNKVCRSLTSKTPVVMGGHASHDSHHDAHGHDDHDAHAPHPMWDLPFNPRVIATIVFGSLFGGVGVVLLACRIQNKKHGFSK